MIPHYLKRFHCPNEIVARKLQTLLSDAELAYQLSGRPHLHFFRSELKRTPPGGAYHRCLQRLVVLTPEQAKHFTDSFLKEFGV